jgi:hypothetical protein
VVRTIYLPNDNITSINFQLESMKLQLEEQRKLFDQKDAAWEEERKVLLDAMASATARADVDQDGLRRELHKVEESLTETTKGPPPTSLRLICLRTSLPAPRHSAVGAAAEGGQ